MSPQLIIGLIGGLVPLVTNLMGWLQKAHETLQQSAELTPDQEKELDDYIAKLNDAVWWKIDPDPAASPSSPAPPAQ